MDRNSAGCGKNRKAFLYYLSVPLFYTFVFLIAYAKAALTDMYGSGVVARIQDGATKVTHWGQNPWTFGSYSAALPGASKMHAEMARPVAGLVFFAGEACDPPKYNGSLPAAYVSGLQASRDVIKSLAGMHPIKPTPTKRHTQAPGSRIQTSGLRAQAFELAGAR